MQLSVGCVPYNHKGQEKVSQHQPMHTHSTYQVLPPGHHQPTATRPQSWVGVAEPPVIVIRVYVRKSLTGVGCARYRHSRQHPREEEAHTGLMYASRRVSEWAARSRQAFVCQRHWLHSCLPGQFMFLCFQGIVDLSFSSSKA